MANSNFYANIGLNAGFTRSQSSSSSHTEGAAVTTLKPMDENSSITYSNVNNITYQGTQAQGGTFIYNNVTNIQKEAVELRNRYSSESSGFGVGVSAGIGSNGQIKSNGISGNISANRNNRNTDETIHANGSFTNVNEVHNNTGTMTLSGFNQEGGKVTGNIGKVEVVSRQNTSTTTGSSKGMSVGVSSQGIPTSVNVNASKTNGNRAFVDNQSTFVVGEGSNLHVGTVENTGAVIGKEGNSTFKIDTYVGKDIQNYDTMTTTGGSIGVSLGGNPKITNVGFNQDSRDKQGITRNTVVGDVEIAEAEGSPINRDLGKANEVTKDTHSRTNINVESQTIEYLTNPGKLKEDIGKAKKEISDVTTAIKESIHDRGDDNRNFFGQLREVRLSETVNNIAGKRLTEADTHEEIANAFKNAYKDLGYDTEIIFSDPKNAPQLIDKNGHAKVGAAYIKDGVRTIIINAEADENQSKAWLIGTIAEEGSHLIGRTENRQINTGTDEKGLESTGKASNDYFYESYIDNDKPLAIKSDGKDYSKVDFGENVGDDIGLFHGGGPGTWEGVEGLKQLLDYPEDYIYRPEIDHNGDLDFFHLRVHNRAEVATEVIGSYEHKNKDLKIDLGYSMSADGVIAAAGKNNMEKVDEIISVFGRVRYTEKNLPNITKETADKIYIVNLDKDHVFMPGYGDKSSKSMKNAIERMTKKGELKYNKETGYYENRYGVEIKFITMTKNQTKHGGVMMTPEKLKKPTNWGLEHLVYKLRSAGSKLPINEEKVKIK